MFILCHCTLQIFSSLAIPITLLNVNRFAHSIAKCVLTISDVITCDEHDVRSRGIYLCRSWHIFLGKVAGCNTRLVHNVRRFNANVYNDGFINLVFWMKNLIIRYFRWKKKVHVNMKYHALHGRLIPKVTCLFLVEWQHVFESRTVSRKSSSIFVIERWNKKKK